MVRWVGIGGRRGIARGKWPLRPSGWLVLLKELLEVATNFLVEMHEL